MSTERVKMTVEMDVTVPQGLALQAMFKQWNRLASMGSSRMVAFYVDGDGNFKPKCSTSFSEEMPELTEELEKAACVCKDDYPQRITQFQFDFDPVAWKLHKGLKGGELADELRNLPVEVIKVSDADFEKFADALDNAPKANEALKTAMAKLRSDQGNS